MVDRHGISFGNFLNPRLFYFHFMKPTPRNRTAPGARDDQRPVADSRNFPATDYAFQTATLETAAPSTDDRALTEARTFRKISRHFLEAGSSREYVAEATAFACITLTTAWPLGVLVKQLTSMMIRY